jgi:mercuric ion transport protein
MNGAVEEVRPAPAERTGKWSLAASVSSFVSAFMASACCIGPLVLGLLGMGGAGLLVKFEPYRPYFMAVTFALLGTGFYLTYRKPKTAASVADGPNCDCPSPAVGRAGKIMLWAAAVLAVILLAFPYLAPVLFR